MKNYFFHAWIALMAAPILLSVSVSDCSNNNKGGEPEAVDSGCTTSEYVFPVHFCVVTNNGIASSLTELDMRNEIDTLNKYFSAEDESAVGGRKKLVSFTFKSWSDYSTVRGLGSKLVLELNQAQDYNGSAVKSKFNRESNRAVRDRKAINIYIYDSWSTDDNFGNTDGHGRYNSGSPYMLLDIKRLKHNVQAPEEHEMGHCFGLAHVCSPVSTVHISSNIMSSTGNYPEDGSYESGGTEIGCEGDSAGARDIGFNNEQCEIILRRAGLNL